MEIFTNIKSLQRMGIYAARDARSPSLNFRRYNLIYGFNGSGKSTLSRLFASLETGVPHPKLPQGGTFEVTLENGRAFGSPTNFKGLEQRLLVFNLDYIEQNLQWAVGRAQPVFYIGADQADAAAELKRLIDDISKAEAKGEAAAATKGAADKTFSSYKRERAKFVASRLHLGSRKYEAPALAKDFDTWKDHYGSRLTDEELKAAEDTRRLDEPMPRLEPISFDQASIETAYRFIAEVCGQSLATVALEEVQQHPDMLLWLKHGHEYHNDHGLLNCLLCGNDIPAERRASLAAALDDKVDQFVARLKRTAERLDDLLGAIRRLAVQLPVVDDLASELRPGFRNLRQDASLNAHQLVEQLSTLQGVLSAKLVRPASPAGMKDVAAEADVRATAERLALSVARFNETIAAHNQGVADFTKRKADAETSLRRHFIIECREEYEKMAQDVDDATVRLAGEADALAALRNKARELQQRVRTHGPAAAVINKLIAAYLGHGELTINPTDEGYELHRHGALITGVPSEGEKTAIAIAYFLSSIEADNRKLKDVIVVVDDPVSSLDTKALNFACSLVRTRLENAAQVFVLTHNLQCMNEFKKAWKGRARPSNGTDPTATFLYIDVTIPEREYRRSSKIIEMSKLLREYDSEYHFLFSHVMRFIEQPDAYNDHGYMMPNMIRRVLDVFLAFKSPGGGGLASQLNTLCADYQHLDREKLAALERLAQVESHSDNLDDLLSFSTMTLEETRGAAAALFTMMEHVDEKHLKRLRKLCS